MTRAVLLDRIGELVDLYFQKRVSRSAAQLAYFLTLSFFPMLICVNAVVSLFPVAEDGTLGMVADILPAESLGLVTEYLQYIGDNRSLPLLLAGLILLFSSASAGFRALTGTVDDIYGRKRHTGLRGLVLSFFYTLALLLVIYGMILVLFTGGWFMRLLAARFALPAFLANWHWLRFLILFGALLLLVYAFYRTTAPRGARDYPVFRGAAIVAALLVLVSVVFSWMISFSSRYALVYGSLAAVMVLMLWLYLCGNILIMGAVYNRTLVRKSQRALKKAQRDRLEAQRRKEKSRALRRAVRARTARERKQEKSKESPQDG